MKIPETTPNVGAYYGNEENGQWQPNGLMLDGGVGGGVVGSGDAGLTHHGVYPPHTHPHPGYVMAGAYYPGPAPAHAQPDDFSDYMWMENEEEFDKQPVCSQVMRQLEDEALMEQCIEAMLDQTTPANGCVSTDGASSLSLEETVSRSTLNPMAAEFVPTWSRVKEEREKPAEVSASSEVVLTSATETDTVDSADETHTSAAESPPSTEPVEVSATATPTRDEKRPQEARKPNKKTQAKKPETAKSDTKLPTKKESKKEVRAVKSGSKVESSERQDVAVPVIPAETVKVQPLPAEEPAAPAGPKPINYAAAAKANKPKKQSPPPIATTEKLPTPPPVKSQDKLQPAKTKPDRAATKPAPARASARN